MIEIQNVTKAYDNEPVLKNLNCSIKKGSIYGLVGANGAGKSTLLRLINGIYKQEEGTIKIDSEDVFDNEKLKQKMVFLPDDLFFYSGYNLLQMADFYKAMYYKFDYTYFLKLTDIFKLDKNTKIQTFSKGMKRQAALILAISTKAEYMLFDETYDGLDPVVRNLVKKIICQTVAENNTTVILTSHNLRELEDTCDQLGLLYKGGIIFQSDVSSLKTKMLKIQLALNEDFNEKTIGELEIMSFTKKGSIATVIVKEELEKCKTYLESKNPIILDFLPLTLEEIFIYEMEVLGYEFNGIV